jgi:hypothetical protein
VALNRHKVVCFDIKQLGIRAASVYQTVAPALSIFRDNEWVDEIGHGQTPIVVRVKHQAIWPESRKAARK